MKAETGDASGAPAMGDVLSGENPCVNPETELVREYLDTKSERAFTALVGPHLGWLRRLLYAIFNGQRHDMEDAEQEILLGFLSDIGRFRFQSGFKTFFYRYARNKAIDHLRRLVRRSKRENGPLPEMDHPTGISPEDAYLRQETLKSMAECLLLLDREDRTMLLMKEREGFSLEEIAAVNGMKIGTIKSRLHRAREKLFHLMEGGKV
jgi:RNA polymerase sigma-70 factor, ECF subfamily